MPIDIEYQDVRSDHNLTIPVVSGATAIITVLSGGPLYYSNADRNVIPGNAQGTLTVGQTATFATTYWIGAFSLTAISILNSGAAPAGAGPAGAAGPAGPAGATGAQGAPGTFAVPVGSIPSASGSQLLTVAAGGQAYQVTLTGNWTPTLTGATAGTECLVDFAIKSDSGGGHVITWPGSVSWLSGVAPPTVVFGTTQLVTLASFDGGITWLGSGPGSVIPSSVLVAKGDVIAASAASTAARLAVGSDGQVLSADSTQVTGVKWVAQASPYVAPVAISMPLFSTQASYDAPQYVADLTNFVTLIGRVAAIGTIATGTIIIAAGGIPSPAKRKYVGVTYSGSVDRLDGLQIFQDGSVKYWGSGMVAADTLSLDNVSYWLS